MLRGTIGIERTNYMDGRTKTFIEADSRRKKELASSSIGNGNGKQIRFLAWKT